ncbi:MAG: protein phosphatase 2C domain-containing protein [Planctomycetota bacterium]
MDVNQLAPGEARTFCDVDMLEPATFSLAGGSVAVLSSRCPEKSSPNEDAAAIICTGPEAALLVVADGCGGMLAGEQAARILIDAMVDKVVAAVQAELVLRAAILDAVEAANQDMLAMRNGCGATLAVVQLEGGEARSYHVGDSQIMLVGGRGKIKLLTTSHSPVGYAVESGLLDEREALEHEDRHLVSNIVGVAEMHVEMGSARRLAERDGVLVASDGVIDNLLQRELVELLRSGSAQRSAAQIATLARRRMDRPQDGLPSKPDDQTLIVFTRRG